MKKKILSLVLCMALVLTAFSGVFAVSAEDTSTQPEIFTTTNSISGRDGNVINYSNFANRAYVERPVTALNTDGISNRFACGTDSSKWPSYNACGNFDNELYADAAADAKAVVTVITADEYNTDKPYYLSYKFVGITHKISDGKYVKIPGSITTMYILNPDGTVSTVKETVSEVSDSTLSDGTTEGTVDLYATQIPAGATAVYVSTVAEGTDLTNLKESSGSDYGGMVCFDGAGNNAQSFPNRTYYLDSIGLVSDVDTFVAAISVVAKPMTVAAWNVKGDAGARWTLDALYADTGIVNYHVNIFDSTGAFVKSVTTAETEVAFDAVAGATYSVQVAGYDANGNRVTTPVKATTTITNTNYNTTASPGYSSSGSGFAKTTGVVRTTNEHNPDGKSHQFTLSGGTGYGWFNVQSGYSATLTTGALVWVVSADENNASAYPFKLNSGGTPGEGSKTFDVVSFAADGTVTTSLGIDRTSFAPGSTNYVIVRNDNGQYWSWEKTTWNPMLCLWSDVKADDCSSTESPLIYYSDSIGYTEDPDALINRLTATETVSPYFTVTKDTFTDGCWSNYNEHGLVNRPVTAHNPDGTSFKIATNLTGGWDRVDFYGCYNGVGDALVMVITVDEKNVSAYPMHIGINGQNIQEFTLIKFDTAGNITTTPTIKTINIEAGCTYYAIMSIADITEGANFNNPNSEMRIWTDYGEAKNYDSCFYVDAIGVASNKENLISALTSGEVMSGITLENTEITVPEGNDITLGGNIASGLVLDKTYSVSDPNVISVNGETLTAIGGGTAYASLTVDGYTDFANCKITVIPVDSGDVNYDGECNVLDLIRMKKYLALTTEDISKKGADCYEDGTVDSNDLVSIRQILLGVQKKNQ